MTNAEVRPSQPRLAGAASLGVARLGSAMLVALAVSSGLGDPA